MMKSTERFKETIQEYLFNKALSDELFAVTYAKENKNIDDCITYILNTVQKSGCNGFTEDEIYSMSVHYYDEDNIEVGKEIDMHVVVNHKVELTQEEKEEAKEKAIREVINEEKRKVKAKYTPTLDVVKTPENGVKTDKPLFIQTSLF